MSHAFHNKLLQPSQIPGQVETLRKHHKKIVTTNGCFDLLHLGHVRYLQEAKKMGDILIVGVNSDASVKKLKGEGRPVNNEMSRAEVLAALEAVDFVTIFPEDTPERLLAFIQPDIHVKGGDYEGKDLPERKVVEASGGEVRFVPFVPGHSTTALLK